MSKRFFNSFAAIRVLFMATVLLQVVTVIAGTVIPLSDGTVYESTLPVVYIDTENAAPVKEKHCSQCEDEECRKQCIRWF